MINTQEVEKIFMDCLHNPSKKTKNNIVIIEGITCKFGFHPKKLELHKERIIAMLSELPTQFRQNSGGGWSFLNACNTKDGEQWTGLHQRMEQLFVLGMGIGKAKYVMPRKMWNSLPGGMPYIVIYIRE